MFLCCCGLNVDGGHEILQTCPVCLIEKKDMAFNCGHQVQSIPAGTCALYITFKSNENL
jgi:hypothetical protein